MLQTAIANLAIGVMTSVHPREARSEETASGTSFRRNLPVRGDNRREPARNAARGGHRLKFGLATADAVVITPRDWPTLSPLPAGTGSD